MPKKRKHVDQEADVIGKLSLSDRCRIISRRYLEHLSGSRPPRRRASLPLLFHSDRNEMKQSRKRARLSLDGGCTAEDKEKGDKCCRGWQSKRRGKNNARGSWTAPWPWMERPNEVEVECTWAGSKYRYMAKTSPPPAKLGLTFKP